MTVRWQTILLCLALSLGSFPLAAAEKPVVYSVNYPLHYFAQRIGGEHVETHFPVPANEDPAQWQADAETIRQYQQADLILLNGAGYAGWVNKASLPRLKLVNTSRGFRDQYIQLPEGATHSHGPGGTHAHTGVAFTTWLDPLLASKQAEAIRDALIRKRPDLSDAFSDNYASLNQELEAMDRRIRETVAKQPGQPLLASHPVYQYLAHRYELNLESVHWEPETVPSDSEWRAMQQITSRHPARWMLWEGKPQQETVARLQRLLIQSVVYRPCANVPEEGDFISVMKENLRSLEAAFPEMGIR